MDVFKCDFNSITLLAESHKINKMWISIKKEAYTNIYCDSVSNV